MSGLELLVDEIDGRLFAAVVKKTVLHDLYVDPVDRTGAWASVYLGKVVKIDKNLDAAIVDLGQGLQGIIAAKHVHFAGDDASSARSGIADLLDPGQTIMVQIKSEAKKESENTRHKLPRLTMKLCAIGQFLLYSPLSNQVTISREIENEKILGITTKLGGKGGWIVQSNAERATEETLRGEEKNLLAEWEDTRSKLDNGDNTPRLIKQGPTAVERVFNDYGAAAFDHIYVGNKKILNTLLGWCERHDPALANSKRLRLFTPEQVNQKLFDLHDIFSELDGLDEQWVPLNDGGSIVIEPTHAVIMIDVNQGNANSIAEANQQAAREIARQVRLRNLSGAILADFIGMHQKSERLHLIETVEDTFKGDYSTAQVHGFTRLGIVEITRKRRTATLAEKLKK